MTLIAAWITPEFRTVASDSKCYYRNNISITCQKVFANSNLAIGLYGVLSKDNRDKVNSVLINNPQIGIDEFIKQLKLALPEFFIGDSEINHKDKIVTHIVIVPKSGDSEIYCFQRKKIPIRISLTEYKRIYQKGLAEDLFFSEQLLPNDEIDFLHQKNLTKQFEKSKQLTEFDYRKITHKSIKKLFIDFYSTVYYESELNKGIIGWDKIYLAVSLKNENWRQIEFNPIPFANYKEQRAIDDMKQIFGF